MGLGRTIARRSLAGRPARTLFSILGVALGIATVVAVFTVDHVSITSRTRRLDPGWGADLEVRPSARLADPQRELLQLEGVAGVAVFFQNDVRVRRRAPLPVGDAGDDAGARGGAALDDDRWLSVRLVALEAGTGPALGVYHVEQGRDLSASEPEGRNGVLIGRSLAERLGVEPGDDVFLAAPLVAARKACVEGRLLSTDEPAAPPPEELFRVTGVLARDGIGRKAQGALVVIDYADGRRLFRDVHVESRFWLRRDGATDLEDLESRLARDFTFERNQVATVGQMADERAFRNGVRLAGLFALLLGLYVIFHTLSMSLIERVREVGTLHALGATRAQIARVFLSEALFIATVAGVLGVTGGVVLAAAMLWMGITTLGVQPHPVGPFGVPWASVLTLTVLGVAVALVGSVYPILQARGADVVGALRGEQGARRRHGSRGFHVLVLLALAAVVPGAFFLIAPVVGAASPRLVGTVLFGLAVLAAVVAFPFLFPAAVARVTGRLARPFAGRWPLAGRLAGRSLELSPGRTGAAVTALALVVAAFVALAGMTASLRAEIEEWGARAVAQKLFVEGLPDVPFDALAAELRALPGVAGVESSDARAYVDFLLIGTRHGELAGYGPAARDPSLVEALAERQGVVVSERLARQRGVAVGDEILVATTGHDVQSFPIVAVSDAYGYTVNPDERAYAVTSDRWLERYFCVEMDVVRNVAVRLAEGGDPDRVEAFLRARHPSARLLRSTRGTDVLRYHLDDIDRDFVVFDIVLLLTALLAGLGVLNGQLLAALERQKELGVLRALGMTRGQVSGALLLESGIAGLCGGLLGAVVGAATTPLLVSSLRALSGLDLPLRLPLAAAAAGVAGAVVLALAAGLYPLWRTSRMDAVQAVRTGSV